MEFVFFPLNLCELAKALLQACLERTDTQTADKRTPQRAWGDFCTTSAAAMIRFFNVLLEDGL